MESVAIIMSFVKFLIDLGIHLIFLKVFHYIIKRGKIVRKTVIYWVYLLFGLSFLHALFSIYNSINYYDILGSLELYIWTSMICALIVFPIKDYLLALSLAKLFYNQGLK